MKKLMMLAMVLCMALSLNGAVAEDAAELQAPTLMVTGEAQVLVDADSAEVTLGVSTLAATVSEASADNSAAIDRLLSALQAAGISKEDIVTENFSVSPVYDYLYGKMDEGEKVTGYRVQNQVRVTVRDTEQMGKVLDEGMTAGANEVYGVTFHSDKTEAARDEALRAAIAEARRKAVFMAEANGMKLGALVSVVEEPYATGTGVTFRYAADSAKSTAIRADHLTVSAKVTLMYQMTE